MRTMNAKGMAKAGQCGLQPLTQLCCSIRAYNTTRISSIALPGGTVHKPLSLALGPRPSPCTQLPALAVNRSTPQAALAPVTLTDSRLLFRFIVPEYVTNMGEHLKVVGSLPELGTWDLNAAPMMVWNEGHRWVLESRLPRCPEFEFKVVAVLGGEVRWEQGINRVVQAEDDGLDMPVELVINLTCSFDLTQATGMELVLDRTSIQESLELASATLELLQKRRTRLVRALQETSLTQGPEVAEQQAEAARLDAAVSSQARSLDELSSLVAKSRLTEDGKALLLALPGNKVEVPRGVGFLSQAHAAISLALGSPPAGEMPALPVPEAPPEAHEEGAGVEDASDRASQAAQMMMGSPWDDAGFSSGFSSDDYELEPDDAAAAMAAAAYASLSSTQRGARRNARRAAAAAAAAAVAAAGDEGHISAADAVASAMAASVASKSARASNGTTSVGDAQFTGRIPAAPSAKPAAATAAPAATATSSASAQATPAPADHTPAAPASAVTEPAAAPVASTSTTADLEQPQQEQEQQQPSPVQPTSSFPAMAKPESSAPVTQQPTMAAEAFVSLEQIFEATKAPSPAPDASKPYTQQPAAASETTLQPAFVRSGSPDVPPPAPPLPPLKSRAVDRAGSPLPVDVPADLPPPKVIGNGMLFFSADLLAAVKLPPTPPQARLASPSPKAQTRRLSEASRAPAASSGTSGMASPSQSASGNGTNGNGTATADVNGGSSANGADSTAQAEAVYTADQLKAGASQRKA